MAIFLSIVSSLRKKSPKRLRDVSFFAHVWIVNHVTRLFDYRTKIGIFLEFCVEQGVMLIYPTR
jgi:hypothetical protein